MKIKTDNICPVCGNEIKEKDITVENGWLIKSCPYCKTEIDKYRVEGEKKNAT